jgi:hypothetical protein
MAGPRSATSVIMREDGARIGYRFHVVKAFNPLPQ